MSMTYDSEHVELHRLFIRPGKYLHTQYWEESKLATWCNDYQNFSALQPEIDRQLRAWLGWKWPDEVIVLSHRQRHWIRWMGRLPVLLTALGLIHLRCPDYLLLGEYRQHFIALFGNRVLNQIVALWKGGDEDPEVVPDDLPEYAFIIGLQLFSQLVCGDWVGQMIVTTLPLIESHLVPEPVGYFSHEGIDCELMRLGRFL